jgi:hypothetical protein
MDEQENLYMASNWNLLEEDDGFSRLRRRKGSEKERLHWSASRGSVWDSNVLSNEKAVGEEFLRSAAVTKRNMYNEGNVGTDADSRVKPVNDTVVSRQWQRNTALPTSVAAATALWGAIKEAVFAHGVWPELRTSNLSAEALWRTAQRYDMVVALVALLGALHIVGVLGELVSFTYYVGMPLHRTWRMLMKETTSTRQHERLQHHLCFWSMACALWAIRYAMVHRVLPAWQMLLGTVGFGQTFATICQRIVHLGFHVSMNVLMWWQPRSACPGEAQEFRGAASLWMQSVHQWIVPYLSRIWQRIEQQIQTTR